jgi:hypothetical protein
MFNSKSTPTTELYNNAYLSSIEQEILLSNVPIQLDNQNDENEEITVLGQTGRWINKSEALNWRGKIPLDKYPINNDPNPQIIDKKTEPTLEFIQTLAICYLRPPT